MELQLNAPHSLSKRLHGSLSNFYYSKAFFLYNHILIFKQSYAKGIKQRIAESELRQQQFKLNHLFTISSIWKHNFFVPSKSTLQSLLPYQRIVKLIHCKTLKHLTFVSQHQNTLQPLEGNINIYIKIKSQSCFDSLRPKDKRQKNIQPQNRERECTQIYCRDESLLIEAMLYILIDILIRYQHAERQKEQMLQMPFSISFVYSFLILLSKPYQYVFSTFFCYSDKLKTYLCQHFGKAWPLLTVETALTVYVHKANCVESLTPTLKITHLFVPKRANHQIQAGINKRQQKKQKSNFEAEKQICSNSNQIIPHKAPL